jgi:hypothetical protein
MEREDIIYNVMDLHVPGMDDGLDLLWQGTDGQAHFTVGRYKVPDQSGRQFLGLTISGIPRERERLFHEFMDVLVDVVGQPDETRLEPDELQPEIDVLVASWLLE